ncbi:uncharacterized protein LOC127770146, partial [Oryza glaberrima]|uniref:uncharacterized protein LOC127770146 n=1 Tax=Oryza glaberrima TaxID=4538 RepID=UPI00224C6263
MDRQWMYADRRSKEFIDGVHYFLRVAEANRQKGFICCPCNKCKNQKEYSASRTIHFHLFESGFMPSYNCWTSHGEQDVEMEEDEVEDDNIPDFAQYAGFEGNQTGEEERDADGNNVANDLGQMLQDAKEDCESEKGAHKLDKMLEDHRTSLYPGCEQGHKKLDTTLEFLQWKANNGVSDKAFGNLLKLIKNILPEGNKLPKTTYEAKKIVCPLGLEVQKIHACSNDCILYHGEEYENLEACPVCKALQYKIRRDDPGEVDGQLTKKRISAKVMWYFPIIPRLRRLFRNKGNARMMRWHAEEHQQNGMLRHPADGSQWRNIDRKFKDFGKDARNIRKVVYMGHRRFLAANHPVRKKGKHFEHKENHRTKPKHRSGKTMFSMVKDLKVVFGKGPGSQPIESEDGHAAMWKKNCIFWELPYWEFLDVRHAIDVMHLTKNLCVNLLGFLGVYGKSKDTLEARNDLKHMEQRGDLHPEPKEKDFIADTGLSVDQLVRGAPIPKAELAYKFELGKPLVKPEQLESLPTQMYKFHERYMEMSAKGREMFGARIRNPDFLQGDDVLWIHFKELFDLYQLDALDVSL